MRVSSSRRTLLPHWRGERGINVLELLIVIGILAVMISLAIPVGSWIRAKVDKANCMANLRSLYAGFSGYLQEHEMKWPQLPKEMQEREPEDEDKEWEFWYTQLKDYGITKKTWVCPGDKDARENNEDPKMPFTGSYVVTEFDELPNTAYRWLNQPWLIERGQNHSRKENPNMIFPDGSIRQVPAF